MWNNFSRQLRLSDLLKIKPENIDFAFISKNRYLTEDIMRTFASKLRFEDIVCRQPISEPTLMLAVEEKIKRGESLQCFINQIVAYQDISNNFINKYLKYINTNELNRKIAMYRESFVNVMAYLERCVDSKRKPRKLESILYKTLFDSEGVFIPVCNLPTNECTVYLEPYELYEGFEYENRLRLVANKIYEREEELNYCAAKRDEKAILTAKKLTEMGFIA